MPLGDFFCNGWGESRNITSLPVAVNPAGGFNCYWEMPFRQRARITLENLARTRSVIFYYQIDYTLTDVPRRRAPTSTPSGGAATRCPTRTSTRSSTACAGQGHYVGTYLAWGVNNTGWWGEGEIKFYLDGDDEFPTICGTGTEDYFGGAWNFDVPDRASTASSRRPFLGLPQVIAPDGLYRSQQRFGMYRWHIMDPIRFQQRPAGHDPGARLARSRQALPAAAGRHRLDRVLVRPGDLVRPGRPPPTWTPSRSAEPEVRRDGG